MIHRPYLLHTRRLGMRRYVAGDIGQLGPVFADPDAARFYPAMGQVESLQRWIAWNLKNYDDHGHGLWALELRDSGLFIGDAGITWQTVDGERIPEIGWHVHPSHRGRGYATEAGLACLAHGFDALGMGALHSIVDPANGASIAVASRVHAERRAYRGARGPMLLFTTTASQFAARSG